MKPSFHYQGIPRSRIATFDVFSVGLRRHHVSALLEFDVTEVRRILQEQRRKGVHASFTGWIIKGISDVLQEHKEASAYVFNKRKLIIFDDINVSIVVEKKIHGNKVPIPYVIEKANRKSAVEITGEIEKAKVQELSDKDIVLRKKSTILERCYYRLPGLLRRAFWRFLISHPRMAFRSMGNVMVTSVGMIGAINGWFIHKSVHPISFGIGSILKKSVVVDNEIRIREILNMTVLVDHDVIDGAQMVRFLKDFTKQMEQIPISGMHDWESKINGGS